MRGAAPRHRHRRRPPGKRRPRTPAAGNARTTTRTHTTPAELRNGDVVSISTSEAARPQLDWLRAAQRRSTRTKLRAYFKQERLQYELDKRAFYDDLLAPEDGFEGSTAPA